MKKIFVTLFALFLTMAISASAFAENFYIENYIVDLTVGKTKDTQVSEYIETNFYNEAHGIYRNIPYQRGSSVSDIFASYNAGEGWEREYTATENAIEREYHVRIGNPYKTVFGHVTYQIEYDYHIGDKNDELFFNLIGTGWGTDIQKAKLRIVMPDSVDENKIKFFVGKEGVKTSDGRIKYFVENHKYGDDRSYIEAEITRPLAPREGVTIQVEVPKGYFDVHKNLFDYFIENITALTVALMLVLTGFAYRIWFLYGKDEHTTQVVSFTPPENMNSAEVELFYRGRATDKSLVSLLFYLASKGYLKITQTESFLGGTDFTLLKLKNYVEQNPIEAEFFNGLFFKKQVTKSDLQNSTTFYEKCRKILDKINKDREKVFEAQSINWRIKLHMGFLIFNLVLLTLLCLYNFNFIALGPAMFMLLFVAIAVTVFVAVGPCPFIIVWSLGFGGMPLVMLFALSDFNFSPSVITGLVCILISCICFYQLPKRSHYSNQVFGQILGFKKFLETAEKQELQAMVEKNPSYFYDILPYAYVLDVSDKWIKKFEGMISNPEWYSGSGVINAHSFNSFASSMSSASGTSSSGGHGGGGHGGCGGGHGGGGGGSW